MQFFHPSTPEENLAGCFGNGEPLDLEIGVSRRIPGLRVVSVASCPKITDKGVQVFMIADEILKKVEFDAIYLVYNKFQSVMSFLPTVATISSPEIMSKIGSDHQSELDQYEIEGAKTQAKV
jgi:hypothetical protein